MLRIYYTRQFVCKGRHFGFIVANLWDKAVNLFFIISVVFFLTLPLTAIVWS
jgi:hypothetical protein